MCAGDRGPGSAGKWLDSDLEKVSKSICVCACVCLCVTERGDRRTEIRGNPRILVRLPLPCKEATPFPKHLADGRSLNSHTHRRR